MVLNKDEKSGKYQWVSGIDQKPMQGYGVYNSREEAEAEAEKRSKETMKTPITPQATTPFQRLFNRGK